MLDIVFLRENPEKVKQGISNKKADPKLVDEFLGVDKKWKVTLRDIEELRAKQRKAGEERKIEEAKALKDEIKAKELKLAELEVNRNKVLYAIPNVPLSSVLVGKDESENKVVKEWGKVPKFTFLPKDHMVLGEALGIIDAERAAKVSGARFHYLKGDAVLLEIALVHFVFHVLSNQKILKKIADSVKKGYSPKPFVPVIPPVMIKPDVFRKMARLRDDNYDDIFHLKDDELSLVGSAEHTLGSMHINEVLNDSDLPIRYIGFSPSFRREAGSYGKDTRGLIRVHQFDKLEMESFTRAEDALTEHKFFSAIQEYLVQQLKIPYHVVAICTGDMGVPNVSQFDIDSWMPGDPSTGSGQGAYRETHTADYTGDYQARRLNTKYRTKEGKSEFAHMNDATAFAVSRTLVAILENYQTKDGKVNIPKVLQKYVGKKTIQ